MLPSAVGDWRIVVVGDGDYLTRLRETAEAAGIADRVTFTGFVDQATKVDYLRRAHVAVCPSLKEGWGLTNIEANACGTPVVAANVPGLRDSARDGETGLLYSHGDIPALADCLNRILSDQELWNNLVAGGLSWAQKFQWDTAAKETELLLEQILKRT
jgi:glycosyltransferase involved in cell wall biosynthesis